MLQHRNGIRCVEGTVSVRQRATVLDFRVHVAAARPSEPLCVGVALAEEHRLRKNIRGDDLIAAVTSEHGSEILGTA